MAGHIPPLTNYAFFPTTVRKKILAIQNQVQSELVLNQPCIVLVWNQFQLYLIPVQYTCHGTINSLYSAYASCYIHDITAWARIHHFIDFLYFLHISQCTCLLWKINVSYLCSQPLSRGGFCPQPVYVGRVCPQPLRREAEQGRRGWWWRGVA